MRRVLTLAIGIGVGLYVGATVVRRIDEAKRSVQPTAVAGRAGASAGSLALRLRVAADEGRRAAAQREHDLRARFDIPDLSEIAAPGDTPGR
ncbi:hypothetical protein FTX61_08920 [Nitriliruptoraceae bacterium ZYF776]|nr:hypothetical protein [Profundirhabdus halotolerans]